MATASGLRESSMYARTEEDTRTRVEAPTAATKSGIGGLIGAGDAGGKAGLGESEEEERRRPRARRGMERDSDDVKAVVVGEESAKTVRRTVTDAMSISCTRRGERISCGTRASWGEGERVDGKEERGGGCEGG
jgi:hypothetical protein